MSSQEEKIQRFLKGKEKNSNKPVATFQLPPILKKDWYLSSWFEKLLFVLGFVALLYSVFSTLIFGFPWN